MVSSEKSNNDSIRLGVRPQHLKLTKSGPIHGTITMIERLGTETVVELISKDKTPFRFVTPDTFKMSVDEVAQFDFDTKQAHLF